MTIDKARRILIYDRILSQNGNPEIVTIRVLAEAIHDWAVEKGFWNCGQGLAQDGMKIALMHSELTEVLEAIRHSNPKDEHCPEFTNTEIELADCIIRILDFSADHNYRIAEAIVAKMKYNETRPYKHGKRF